MKRQGSSKFAAEMQTEIGEKGSQDRKDAYGDAKACYRFLKVCERAREAGCLRAALAEIKVSYRTMWLLRHGCRTNSGMVPRPWLALRDIDRSKKKQILMSLASTIEFSKPPRGSKGIVISTTDIETYTDHATSADELFFVLTKLDVDVIEGDDALTIDGHEFKGVHTQAGLRRLWRELADLVIQQR